MKKLLIGMLLVASSNAWAGPFDIAPSSLEAVMTPYLNVLRTDKNISTEPQSCSRKAAGNDCHMMISEHIVSASGTELPPKTNEILITPGEGKESSNVTYPLAAVIWAYDKGTYDKDDLMDKIFDMLPALAAQLNKGGAARGTVYRQSVNGVAARYTVETSKMKIGNKELDVWDIRIKPLP